MSIAILIAIETFKKKGRNRRLLNILNENPSNRYSGSLNHQVWADFLASLLKSPLSQKRSVRRIQTFQSWPSYSVDL